MFQAIQLRIDGIKSKVKKWATSAKDYVNTDCGTKASTCYIKKKYAECLGVDLKHAGSDELVSNTLIRKKLAIEDTDASKLSAALQTIYYYPPCKAYADVLRKVCKVDVFQIKIQYCDKEMEHRAVKKKWD